LISACDVGIVCTVAGVDSSFPSKTIDYLRAGLPIVAAVEQDTTIAISSTNGKLESRPPPATPQPCSGHPALAVDSSSPRS
jgi:hypothetical protein